MASLGIISPNNHHHRDQDHPPHDDIDDEDDEDDDEDDDGHKGRGWSFGGQMGWTWPCITTPNLHHTNTKRYTKTETYKSPFI